VASDLGYESAIGSTHFLAFNISKPLLRMNICRNFNLR